MFATLRAETRAPANRSCGASRRARREDVQLPKERGVGEEFEAGADDSTAWLNTCGVA
jgi:hypothetical protein